MTREKNLTIGVILPNTKIFGGVKRFFEIGNILIGRDHKFLIFTPEGEQPVWFEFKGQVNRLEKISNFYFDAVFITQPDFIHDLKKSNSSLKVFYAILHRGGYLNNIKDDSELILLANSTRLYHALGG